MQINSFLTENPLGFHYYLHFTYGVGCGAESQRDVPRSQSSTFARDV